MILFVNHLGKMRGYPQFSFWISITLVKIYIPCVIINRGKNTIELVGTVLNSVTKRPEKFRIGWDLSPLTKPANNFFSICHARDKFLPDMQPVWSDKKRRENNLFQSNKITLDASSQLLLFD